MGQLVARYRASTDLAARQKVGAMLVLVVKGISERILMDAAFEKGKDQGLADPVQRRLFGQLLLQQDLMNMMPRGPLTYLDELNSGRSMQGLPLRAAAERVMQEGRYDENVSPADIGAVLDVIMETPDTDKNGYINSAVRHLQKRMNTAAQPQEKEHAIRELLRILYLYGDRTYISTLQKQQQMQQQLTKAILSAA